MTLVASCNLIVMVLKSSKGGDLHDELSNSIKTKWSVWNGEWQRVANKSCCYYVTFFFVWVFVFILFVIVLTHVGGHKRSICCYLVWKSEKTNSYCQTLLSNQLNQKVIPRCKYVVTGYNLAEA